MATGDSTIIQGLSAPSWRGLLLPPYHAFPLEWTHRQAKREYPYVDIAGHDWTGMDVKPFKVECRFLNTQTQAPPLGYARWFPEYWEVFKTQVLDGNPGDLVHPLLGSVRAVVADGSTTITTESLSGITVTITWELTNEDPSTIAFFGDVLAGNPATLASAADAACAEFGVFPGPGRLPQQTWGMYGMPTGASISLSSIWAAISGGVFSLSFTTLAQILALIGDVIAMAEILTSLDACQASQALSAVWAFFSYIQGAQTQIGLANRPTASRTIDTPTTLAAFANSVGNTFDDILGLNPQLIPFVQVPKYKAITYYTAA
jgi:hypothetical protein